MTGHERASTPEPETSIVKTESRSIHGHSEMARLIQDLDWTATPLGPVESWSETLLAAVNMMLGAPVPMQLFWGAEFICIYNDAMAPALSDKHPVSLGKSAKTVWSEAWEVIGAQLEQVLQRGEPVTFSDALVPVLLNGILEDQYWTYSYSPVLAPDGSIAGVLDIARNSTATVLAQRELQETVALLQRSEERFRILIDRASVGINIGDSSGALSYLNKTLMDILGYTKEEMNEGKVRWDELTPEKYAAADRQALVQLKETGVAQPYEKAYRAKNGRLVPVQLGAVLIPALSAHATEDDIAVFFTDLTNLKKAEAAMLQAEKVGAVGKLASAISHEINNPLEAITNLLFIVQNLPDLPQAGSDYLAVANRELARVSQIAAQTLRFHRLSTNALTIHPDLMVEEVLDLYAGRLDNYGVEVKRDYGAGLTFACFEGDVRQVLNNLLGNALDAMKTGGRLTVRTREATRWSNGSKGVLFTIADSGYGIAPESMGHLFDAFFTTKGIHGTGLGLWISCRIVHKHRGYIRAHNAVAGRGAVFQLWLPVELAPSANEPWHILGKQPEW